MLKFGNTLMPYDVLIVDDEKDIRDLIAGTLEDEGYETRVAQDGVSAIDMIKTRQPSLVILDVWLGDSERDGLKILELIKRDHGFVPVIMISGHGTIETAVTAIKNGAYDFIEKPFATERLLLVVERAIDSARLKQENEILKVKSGLTSTFIGTSSMMNQVRNLIQDAAKSQGRVLITGSVGVGKETIARTIHDLSDRQKGSFVAFSCNSFSPNMIESELWGAELQEQSTDTPRKIGAMEKAHGGTIYLEEIADLPLPIQGKLIKFLQDGYFYRVGGQQQIKVNVRVIAGTSQHVANAIRNGHMREDLFYRLSAIHIQLPSLKERVSDIPLLINYFMKQISTAKGSMPRKFSDDAIALLQSYPWPGNLHQLRNVVEWILIMAGGNPLESVTGAMLPPEIISGVPFANNWQSKTAEIVVMPLREAREAFEKEYLLAQMQRFEGNVSQTARFIGMERSALHRKLRALGVMNDGVR